MPKLIGCEFNFASNVCLVSFSLDLVIRDEFSGKIRLKSIDCILYLASAPRKWRSRRLCKYANVHDDIVDDDGGCSKFGLPFGLPQA